MPPAATLGSQTAHGTPLLPGPGSVNVFIGGKPAWRALADSHTCPLVDVLKPHLGGVVIKCSTTVIINGFPAARMGDLVIEAGASNPIASGETTVIIGG